MATKQVTTEIPEHVLLAEMTDPRSFGREMRVLSAVKLYEFHQQKLVGGLTRVLCANEPKF